MQSEVMFAGFGGQGILLIGKVLAHAAMEEGFEVAWIPSYGPEMRGGTCNCTADSLQASVSQVSMYMMLDNSGSMAGTRWAGARTGLNAFHTDPGSDPINYAFRWFGDVPVAGGDRHGPPPRFLISGLLKRIPRRGQKLRHLLNGEVLRQMPWRLRECNVAEG